MATKPKAETNVPAVQQGGALAFSQEMPDHLKNQTGPGRGSEEVGSKDIVLPRLEIVQAQSPIKEIEDCKDGDLFNTASSEVYGDTVYFVNVYYRMEFLIWKDQDSGGGFFGSYPTQGEAEARFKDLIEDDPSLAGTTKDGKPILEIVDTPVHYGMLVDPASAKTQQIVISMPKSKSKVSRKWNALIQMTGGDRFSRVYRISTFTDKNKQDKKFKNFTAQPAGYTPAAVFQEAEKLYGIFKAGAARAGHDQVIDNEADQGAGEPATDNI
jgi:hypothetical protein